MSNLSLISTGGTAVAPMSHPADTSKSALKLVLPPVESIQPIADVPGYLAERRPVPHFVEEPRLFITLPQVVRAELFRMLGRAPGGGMFGKVSELARRGTIERAVQEVVAAEADWCLSWQRTRARFDLWLHARDWVVLVNRSKAGGGWIENARGLPDEFLKFCAAKFGAFKRWDGKRQALFAIKRQWKTGLNERGEREAIPGYGFAREWWERRFPEAPVPQEIPVPSGWSYANILSTIKARGLFRPAVRKLLHEGTSAARSELPTVRTTREGLRFMEWIEFDDVRTDFLVFDPESGQVVELWLLIARDLATSILLGFGMRPAKARDDGRADHLKLRDMKQLCGWLLEAYGLPPYAMTWKLERGTATLSEGSVAVLGELLPERVKVSFSSMVGGKSAAGFLESGIGNSKGKASLESHNRLMHTMGAHLPGQSGNLYAVRPQDLNARSREAAEVWALAAQLPERYRGGMRYPVLTVAQAGAELRRIFALQNTRTEHELEGFDQVLEWLDLESGQWRMQAALDRDPQSVQWRQRKESPVERAARLVQGLAWSRVSPDVVAAFFEHTARQVVVKSTGEIAFRADGREFLFACPPGGTRCAPGDKLLAYFHPDDPLYLHLTDGHGRIVGTWLRRDRVAHHDQRAISEAIAYTRRALNEAREEAAALDGEAPRLEAMRAENARLLESHSFVAVGEAPVRSERQIGSAVARALASGRREGTADESGADAVEAAMMGGIQ